MVRLTAVFAALILAGCGAETQSAEAPPVAAPEVEAPVQTAPSEAAAIPAAFQGTWDDDLAACADAHSLTRLTISATELRFWESIGDVTSVDASAPSEILIGTDMDGEGLSWTRTWRFSLSNDGATLTDLSEPDGAVRQKCPS